MAKTWKSRNGALTPVMPKITERNPLTHMLKVMITPMILRSSNHPNHADNVCNLRHSSNAKGSHNVSPKCVKTLRNAKPNPNRDNKVSVAGTPLLEPPRPERLRSFGRIFTLLAFAASRRSHGHRGYKFSSVSRRDAAAYPNRCTFAQARRHETTP